MDMAVEASRKINNPDEWPEATRSAPGFFLAWTYKRTWLPRDLAAGLVIFAVTVPAALAYGEMAGLDAVNGLYACLVAMAIYAVLGTSRHCRGCPGSSSTMARMVSGVAMLSFPPSSYALKQNNF